LSTPKTFKEPNRYAREAKLELSADSAVFHGYQEFILTKEGDLQILPVDKPLQLKRHLLTPYFETGHLHNRTFLDLGANGGFFCFWALQKGARKALALDIDETYLGMIQSASERLGVQNIEIIQANMADWNDPVDIVCALSLVHWIYSCTAVIGSLDKILKHLSLITKFMLIVEWVAPEDPAIQFFHHIDWNKDFVEEPYIQEAFEAALKANFSRVDVIGDVSSTRKLYAAFKEKHTIDISGPLPFLRQGKIISSRILAVYDNVPYWSQVYEDPLQHTIIKQATLDLASREYLFLSRLKSAYFPKPISYETRNGFSIITIEKIHGLPLEKAIPALISTRESLLTFFQHCLNLLLELEEHRILHRDIREDNILVLDNKPVLIDFGWAISEDLPYFTPEGLGLWGRPADGSFCNIYSMGKVFDQLNQHQFPEFDTIIELMTDLDILMRVTDLNTLKMLFNTVAEYSSKISIEDGGEQGRVRLFTCQLIDQVRKRNQLIKWLKYSQETFKAKEKRLAYLEQTHRLLEEITNSEAWRLIQFYRNFRLKLIPRGSWREKFYQMAHKLFVSVILNPLRRLKN